MNSTNKNGDALSRFSIGVFKVNGILMRNGDRLTKSIGQSSARWQVLGRVDFKEQTVAQIARSMGHARQSVQRVADILVREGLVSYVQNPADRRAQLLRLTPKGAEVLSKIYSQYTDWSQHIMTKLDKQQLKAAADALEAIANIIETDVDSNNK